MITLEGTSESVLLDGQRFLTPFRSSIIFSASFAIIGKHLVVLCVFSVSASVKVRFAIVKDLEYIIKIVFFLQHLSSRLETINIVL